MHLYRRLYSTYGREQKKERNHLWWKWIQDWLIFTSSSCLPYWSWKNWSQGQQVEKHHTLNQRAQGNKWKGTNQLCTLRNTWQLKKISLASTYNETCQAIHILQGQNGVQTNRSGFGQNLPEQQNREATDLKNEINFECDCNGFALTWILSRYELYNSNNSLKTGLVASFWHDASYFSLVKAWRPAPKFKRNP